MCTYFGDTITLKVKLPPGESPYIGRHMENILEAYENDGEDPGEDFWVVTVFVGEHKIRPCPFCNNQDADVYQSDFLSEDSGGKLYLYSVDCDKCEAQGPLKPGRHAAITAWNKREEE